MIRLLPISGIPGAFRMIATGERPKKKDILEDLELKRHALLLESGAEFAEQDSETSQKGDGSPNAENYYDEDEDFDDYDYSPERDYERDYSPFMDEYEDAEEPCPELEPSASMSMSKYEDAYERASLSPVHEDHRDEDMAEEEMDLEEEAKSRGQAAGDASRDEMEEEEYEPQLTPNASSEADLEIRRRYEEVAAAEEATPNISPDEAEADERDAFDERDVDDMTPPVEVALSESSRGHYFQAYSIEPADEAVAEEEVNIDNQSNMVDQMAVSAAMDDQPRDDTSGDSRAKLTQMKSEAARRLDDLEKLIDEHQEIVEELKRTESSQGSLVDLANASPTPSPVHFPAATRSTEAAEAEVAPPAAETNLSETTVEMFADEDPGVEISTRDRSEDGAQQFAEAPLAEPDPVDDCGEPAE